MLYKKRSLIGIFLLRLGVLTGTHRAMRDVVIYSDRAVRLSSRRRLYLQSDGDRIPDAEARITIRPLFLSVRVPKAG
jgi:diacylglycerol kinase family enzyme